MADGLVKRSSTENPTSMVPASGSIARSVQPSRAAAGAGGANPLMTSQNGPVRFVLTVASLTDSGSRCADAGRYRSHPRRGRFAAAGQVTYHFTRLHSGDSMVVESQQAMFAQVGSTSASSETTRMRAVLVA